MASKSKVLMIGGTGYIGKFIVETSVKAGHTTFALVRDSTISDPAAAKASVIQKFHELGVNLLYGGMSEHDSLARAIKEVDTVISAVDLHLVAEQVKIIDAIKEAGNVKEDDIAAYAIRSIDDPRTLNKILKLEPVYVPEEEVLKQIDDAPCLLNMTLSLVHSAFVRGVHTNFEIDPLFGVEASMLYPCIKYTT
ncbi:Eugenol synthase 2-like protein [Drosera capensis]